VALPRRSVECVHRVRRGGFDSGLSSDSCRPAVSRIAVRIPGTPNHRLRRAIRKEQRFEGLPNGADGAALQAVLSYLFEQVSGRRALARRSALAKAALSRLYP
jgi:hypothetical protein